MNKEVSRSWFVVLPNPESNGYEGEPIDVLNRLKEEWIALNQFNRGWWAFCISAKGMPHVHMVLESSGPMRFSAVKRAYEKAHLEPTKGSKRQVEAYIKKEPPFAETGEQVICFTSHGDLMGSSDQSLKNTEYRLIRIEEMLSAGLSPSEITGQSLWFQKEEQLIKKAYFRKRLEETPPHREVHTTWHIGESGSGKSYSYIQLCEKHGAENIYFMTDYANGGFDEYNGEPILFMDELKQNSLSYGQLLTILGNYRTQIHCRYFNTYALWTEVHITSIFGPEDIHQGSVSDRLQTKDTLIQLLRRIDEYEYHYNQNEEYLSIKINASEYKGLNEIKQQWNKRRIDEKTNKKRRD